MDEQYLLESAEKMKVPSAQSIKIFEAQMEDLIECTNQLMSEHPDFVKLIGENNQAMAIKNNTHFARFMVSLFNNYMPEVLVNTVLWGFRTYRAHGFQVAYWSVILNNWILVLKEHLSEKAYREISPFYNWLLINVPVFKKMTD